MIGVPVTVYDVDVAGLTETEVPVVADNPAAGAQDQLYWLMFGPATDTTEGTPWQIFTVSNAMVQAPGGAVAEPG